MMTIAERRDMFVLAPRGSGTPALLSVDSVRDLDESMRDFLLPEQARAIVGTGRKVMDHLRQGGLVKVVAEAERVMESRPYRRSQVEAFVSACVGKAKPMTAEAARVAGLTMLTHAVAPGRSVVDLCHALVDGKLRSVATVREASGLMRLRLRMCDVDRVLPARLETLSMEDAAPLLGTNYIQLTLWARKGFLTRAASPHRGEAGQRVERAELERFRAAYVLGGELATLCGQPGNHWVSRHVRHVGVEPVSGPGVDDSPLFLFRRADCTPKVLKAVRRVQARPPGTQTEKHQRAFARSALAADTVAAQWGVRFKRVNNRFTDLKTGRTLQVVSGRRPDLTGAFRFMLSRTSRERLAGLADAWVAFVPDDADTFLLTPFNRITWRGATLDAGYVTVRFDGSGRPLEMEEWAIPLPVARTPR